MASSYFRMVMGDTLRTLHGGGCIQTTTASLRVCKCGATDYSHYYGAPKRYFSSNSGMAQLKSTSLQTSSLRFSVNPSSSAEVESNTSKKEKENIALSSLAQQRQMTHGKRLLEEPEDTEPHVIYRGVLATQMKKLKIFSLTTSGMGLLMQPILIQKASEVPLAANIAIFGMVGFFTFCTPFLIHFIARKYVTEMLYDPQMDTYTASTFTFFLRRRETVFRINDVNVPDVAGPFTTVDVKTKDGKSIPLFFAPEAFTKTSHYGRLMGYDKPIDLHLTDNSSDNTKTSTNKNDKS